MPTCRGPVVQGAGLLPPRRTRQAVFLSPICVDSSVSSWSSPQNTKGLLICKAQLYGERRFLLEFQRMNLTHQKPAWSDGSGHGIWGLSDGDREELFTYPKAEWGSPVGRKTGMHGESGMFPQLSPLCPGPSPVKTPAERSTRKSQEPSGQGQGKKANTQNMACTS